MTDTTHHTLWVPEKPSGGGEPAPAGMADALAEAIGDRLGRPVTYVDEPAMADETFGPGTVVLSLRADDALPTEWMGRLAVFPKGTESAVLAAAALLPCGVAALVTDALAMPAEHGGALAVASVPSGRDLVEAIDVEPSTTTPRLRAMATVQAQLHGVDPRKVDGVPALDFTGVLGALPDELADEAAWLRSHCPPPGSEVLCHGGLSPRVVRIDADDPNLLVFRNWSGAVRAEHTYDIARTLTDFWIAPFFATTRSERRGMLLARDELTNLYRATYQETAPIDDERLAYWQAFHAVVGVADDLRNPGHLPDEVGPALSKRFKKLAK